MRRAGIDGAISRRGQRPVVLVHGPPLPVEDRRAVSKGGPCQRDEEPFPLGLEVASLEDAESLPHLLARQAEKRPGGAVRGEALATAIWHGVPVGWWLRLDTGEVTWSVRKRRGGDERRELRGVVPKRRSFLSLGATPPKSCRYQRFTERPTRCHA